MVKAQQASKTQAVKQAKEEKKGRAAAMAINLVHQNRLQKVLLAAVQAGLIGQNDYDQWGIGDAMANNLSSCLAGLRSRIDNPREGRGEGTAEEHSAPGAHPAARGSIKRTSHGHESE